MGKTPHRVVVAALFVATMGVAEATRIKQSGTPWHLGVSSIKGASVLQGLIRQPPALQGLNI